LAQIYLPNHTFTDYEFRAWKKMLKDVGYTNITPFTKQESQIEFWTRSIDFATDKENILILYQNNLLNLNKEIAISPPPSETNNEIKFWKSFSESLKKNKHGLDGKQRILSVIVENFNFKELHEKLQAN
ncbi:35613_t:CDS:2, partial [Gigaspora margarita]